MVPSCEAGKTITPLGAQIGELLDTEGAWRDDLRGEITRKVRGRFKPVIKREIEKELRHPISVGEEGRKKELRELRRVIFEGETTGDEDFDIVFVLTGGRDEELLEKVRTLRTRINQALEEEENPLFLLVYLVRGGPTTWRMAILQKPSLSIFSESEQYVKYELDFSGDRGHVIQYGYEGFRPSYYRDPFCLLSRNLAEIEFGIPFSKAASQTETGEKIIYFSLFGQEEIRTFLQEHEAYRETVAGLLEVLSDNLDEGLPKVENLLGTT